MLFFSFLSLESDKSNFSLSKCSNTVCFGRRAENISYQKKKQKDKVCSVVHKTLHINIEIEQHEPHYNWGLTPNFTKMF
jgi:hypothetical protein